MRILLIEDDPNISGFVARGLSELGYVVEPVRDGNEALRRIAPDAFDLIILDVMLPGDDGLSVCRLLRQRGIATPILMLTALSSTGDKVAGLDAGADDYLPKPFEFDELAARVKALLRRGRGSESSLLRMDDLELNLLKREATRAGKKIRLTAKEFALLEYFMRNPNRVLTRTAIGERVWEMDFDYGGNVIEVYVSTLRRKIDKGFDRPLIHTVIGMGYLFGLEAPGG
ncbi:MAG: response regulator transcription factor [Phycisphaerae bacterium]